MVIFDKNAERGAQLASELGSRAAFADGDVTSEESVLAGLGVPDSVVSQAERRAAATAAKSAPSTSSASL